MKKLAKFLLIGLLPFVGLAFSLESDESITIAEALRVDIEGFTGESTDVDEVDAAGDPIIGGAAAEDIGGDDGFFTFFALLETTGLLEQLAEPGPYTVFAPSNGAFEHFDKEYPGVLSDDLERLKLLLANHIVKGAYTVFELSDLDDSDLQTLGGAMLEVTLEIDGLEVNGVGLEPFDVNNTYANGIVHAIDGVILATKAGTALDDDLGEDSDSDDDD